MNTVLRGLIAEEARALTPGVDGGEEGERLVFSAFVEVGAEEDGGDAGEIDLGG